MNSKKCRVKVDMTIMYYGLPVSDIIFVDSPVFWAEQVSSQSSRSTGTKKRNIFSPQTVNTENRLKMIQCEPTAALSLRLLHIKMKNWPCLHDAH